MQPLNTDVESFIQELDEIESIFATCKGARTVSGYVFRYAPTEDGCLVALWDAWNRFLRSLVMTSVTGPTYGLSGAAYAPVVAMTESQVLSHLQTSSNRKAFGLIQGEPKWTDSTCLSNIAVELGLSNATVIVAAVGSHAVNLGPVTVSNPLEEIRKCRNFIAHKNQRTLDGVLPYATQPFVDLTTHVREKRSGVEAFSEWKDCLGAIAEASAQ